MASLPRLRLNNNATIPSIAFGTGTAWFAKNEGPINSKLVESIKEALNVGFTHLDCAEMYGTERDTGVAIKESGIARDRLFITTKVSRNITDPIKSLDDSLARLQLDYVDLYLIHTPFFDKEKNPITLKDAWKALETTVDQGKAKSIGVSNFRVSDLEELLSFARIKPVVNQIEFHPYLLSSSGKIVEFSNQNEILIESFGPLASIVHKPNGPVDPVVSEIANRLGKSPAQVLLRWNCIKTKGVVVTTSSKIDRLKEYLGTTEVDLSQEDVEKIDEAGRSSEPYRRFWADKPW